MKDKPNKMIGTIDEKEGSFSEILFNMKEKLYENNQYSKFTPEIILKEIYSIVNPNLDLVRTKQENLKFKFNLNSINIYHLKQLYLTIIQNNITIS